MFVRTGLQLLRTSSCRHSVHFTSRFSFTEGLVEFRVPEIKGLDLDDDRTVATDGRSFLDKRKEKRKKKEE